MMKQLFNEKTKILSFHPYSLYENGGSSRILRRLYEDFENNIIVLYIKNGLVQGKQAGMIKEVGLGLFPPMLPWMRWHLRGFVLWLTNFFFFYLNAFRIRSKIKTLDFNILHLVNQGPYSAVLCNTNLLKDKKLWVSFHDHFSVIGSSFEDARLLWNLADRRLVISKEMGEEYSKIFGKKKYELITDGLKEDEICNYGENFSEESVIYFAGLLHIDYYPLFEVLADALDELYQEGIKYTLVLRGTQKLKFLQNRRFKIQYFEFTLDKDVLKNEMNSADFLYLPIKFNKPNFSRFSLSTKMIGYLGAKGKVLYHGPSDSAAYNLLYKNKCAFFCLSLKKDELKSLLITKDNSDVSLNAKLLVGKEFKLDRIREEFWRELTSE